MPETGFIQVHAYESNARLPLEGVSIAVAASDGTVLALRLTDGSGRISQIEVPVPPLSAGLTPDTGQIPFTQVNLYARLSGYELAETPYASSFAGYKDWFIQQYRRPGYTIEVGLGQNPLPLDQFDKIYRDNLGILVTAALGLPGGS